MHGFEMLARFAASHAHSGRAAVFVLLILSCAIALLLSCGVGKFSVSPWDILLVFSQALGLVPVDGDRERMLYSIICELRLGRGVAAILCGGALALSGAMLQGALRNSLADPFTLGISAGAACGASLAIAFGARLGGLTNFGHDFLATASALGGSMLALFLALFLGRGKGSFERQSVILAGIAVATFMGSIVALVKALNEESVTSIVFWMLGSLQGSGWHNLPLLCLALAPGVLAAFRGWRVLDALALGGEQASLLGINLARARLWILGGASCMAAGCVAVCGVIGFVGLAAPHIFRILLGAAHGPLLLASFFGGALFLLVADCAARVVLDGGQELPAGIVTALVGGPFFAFLIRKRQA